MYVVQWYNGIIIRDELVASNLNWNDVKSTLANKTRDWFLKF